MWESWHHNKLLKWTRGIDQSKSQTKKISEWKLSGIFFVWFPFYKSADFVPYSSHLRVIWLACPLSERRARGDTWLGLTFKDGAIRKAYMQRSHQEQFQFPIEPMTCRTAVKIDEVASNGWIACEYQVENASRQRLVRRAKQRCSAAGEF